VTTKASGSGTIVIGTDKSVSGGVTTTGIQGTAAHIHVGKAGTNGPVAVALAKKGDNGWSVAAGAKLSDTQYQSYKAGDLYVNVHSTAHPDGEIPRPAQTLKSDPGAAVAVLDRLSGNRHYRERCQPFSLVSPLQRSAPCQTTLLPS